MADGSEVDGAVADTGPHLPVIRDGTFDVTTLDTGNIEQACTMLAPWGSGSWGLEGATFTDPNNRTLERAHFVTGNQQGYLYGLDDTGKMGFVRFIQGDMWGGGNCGAIPWHQFEPVPTAGNDLKLDLDVYNDTANVFGTTNGWVMLAVNVWFSSPDFVAGTDKTGHKPLVMDLIAHYGCATTPCSFSSSEDQTAYHYQAEIVKAPHGTWTHMTIPLDQHIDAAFQHFNLPAAAKTTLKLYQAEFVVEVRHAEGAASIDNYVVSGNNLP